MIPSRLHDPPAGEAWHTTVRSRLSPDSSRASLTLWGGRHDSNGEETAVSVSKHRPFCQPTARPPIDLVRVYSQDPQPTRTADDRRRLVGHRGGSRGAAYADLTESEPSARLFGNGGFAVARTTSSPSFFFSTRRRSSGAADTVNSVSGARSVRRKRLPHRREPSRRSEPESCFASTIRSTIEPITEAEAALLELRLGFGTDRRRTHPRGRAGAGNAAASPVCSPLGAGRCSVLTPRLERSGPCRDSPRRRLPHGRQRNRRPGESPREPRPRLLRRRTVDSQNLARSLDQIDRIAPLKSPPTP